MQSRYYPHVRKIILNSELLREVELNKLQLQLMSKHNEIKQDEEVIDTFMKSLDDENDSFVLGYN